MEKIEKNMKRLFPRRSPRLLERKFHDNTSTSMVDLNLPVIKNDFKFNTLQRRFSTVRPQIRSSRSENKLNKLNMDKQEKSLKRLRESTVSLRSVENVMPSKRLKQDDSSINTSKYNITNIGDPTKRKFSSKVASLAKGFSPRKSLKKKVSVASHIERASSLRVSKSSINNTGSLARSASVRHHGPSAIRKRNSKLWVESLTAEDTNISEWTPQQIKRQEAIYELYCGEKDLVEDLKLLQEAYRHPIKKLKLMGEEDLASIFGHIDTLLPLHEELVENLDKVQDSSGSFSNVGAILTEWIPKLKPYVRYCANQLKIKDIISQKEKDCKSLSDFLQRCLESPFSRKLDLWAFLDAPRSKLTKYPLLISAIHKYTAKDDPDRPILYRNKKQFETILKEADRETGYTKCSFYKDRLYFIDDTEEYSQAIDNAKTLICHGCLKNKSGNKVDAFLFDTMFLTTRQAVRNGNNFYQVLSQPILTSDMEITDLSDGEIRVGGSFRTTISKGPIAKHIFRVSSKDLVRGKTLILQATNEHDKKQWLNSFIKLLKHETNGIVESDENIHEDVVNGGET